METVVSNLKLGKVRRETYNGKSYLVAPMTLIVPGVLAGSEGGLYYPPDEVAKNPSVWDDTPIVVYHPTATDPTTGKTVNVSARSKKVLDSSGIGFLRSSRYDGKLRAEGWFDEKRTKQVDNRVYKALLNGSKIELSTGLHVGTFEGVPFSSVYQGKPYRAIARNYTPDHLAILPDQVGACSLNDGCGVFAANVDNNEVTMVTNCAGKPSCDCGCGGKTLSWSPLRNATSMSMIPHVTDKPEIVPAPDVTPEKACEIVKDGTVHGKPLSKKQQGMFGAICGERKTPIANVSTNRLTGYFDDILANCGGEGGTPGPCKIDCERDDKGNCKGDNKKDVIKPLSELGRVTEDGGDKDDTRYKVEVESTFQREYKGRMVEDRERSQLTLFKRDGVWRVSSVDVPEALRGRGIAKSLYMHAAKKVGEFRTSGSLSEHGKKLQASLRKVGVAKDKDGDVIYTSNKESAVFKKLTTNFSLATNCGESYPMSYGGGASDGSLQSRMQQVAMAFREAHPTKYDPKTGAALNYSSLVSVFEDYVVYVESENANPSNLYRQSYKVGKSGAVTFTGSPQPVKKVVTYEPVNNASELNWSAING